MAPPQPGNLSASLTQRCRSAVLRHGAGLTAPWLTRFFIGRRLLTTAEAKFGTMPIAALNEPEVLQVFLDWRDKVATTSGLPEAEHRLSQISAMLSWARERGKISANHLKGRKRLYHVDRRENIYTQKDIDAFMAVASIEMKQAMTLGLHTGQREGDLLHLPWSAYDGTTIRLKQSKSLSENIRRDYKVFGA